MTDKIQYRSTTGMVLTEDDNAETVLNCAAFVKHDLMVLRGVWVVAVIAFLAVFVYHLVVPIQDALGIGKLIVSGILFVLSLLFFPNVIVEVQRE